jgi:DivIVA domain-containing protein
MISASIAGTHRFGRVRKNGYDPAEVDAVVQRLVDELRRSDERIATLTNKIDTADASADAIRRTFVAAQATGDQIVEDAHAEASTITDAATLQATTLAKTAEELQSEIAASRDRILTGLYQEAEDRMLEIELLTAQRSVDAEWAVREAIEARDRNVSDTQADAETAVHKAEAEATKLRSRIATMSQAALSLEKAAEAFAATAREGAKVIDLTAMEELDNAPAATIKPLETVKPETVIDEDELVATRKPSEGTTAEEDLPKTRYQSTTGVPLKERIKIARMSG